MYPPPLFRADTYSCMWLWLLLPSALTLLPGGRGAADELLMRDGSRLIGKVVKSRQKTLEFETSYAGVIKIKGDQIVELRADAPVKLMLEDGSIRTAKHIKRVDDALIAYGDVEPESADATLDTSALTFINPEPWRTGEGWKLTGEINFALKRERGNTDKDEIDIDGELLWRAQHDRVTVHGEFERDRSNNKRTKDKWKVNSAYNHFLTKQWYAGAVLGMEHDRFADLNLRTVIGPILGYQWFESSELNLRTEAGPLYVDENFDNNKDSEYPALGWGINFDKYLFKDLIQLYHRQLGLWNLDTREEVVWDTWTGLRVPLIWHLVASTEMQVEYDSGAAQNKDNTDTTFRLKVGYRW